MKCKRLFSLLLAAAMVLSLAGCGFSSPESVGTVNGEEISAGVYLIMQLDAYSDASNRSEGKDPLKSTITVDGTEIQGSDYISQRTQEFLGEYAATHALYAELGGALSEDDLAFAKSYAEDMWASGGKLYEANGIGIASLQNYVEYSIMRSALLSMMYGPDGSEPVSDEELKEYINRDFRKAVYVSFPLINYTTLATLDEESSTQMTALADTAAQRLADGEKPADVAADLLPEALPLVDVEYSDEIAANCVGEMVFTPSQMAAYDASIQDSLMAAKPDETLVLDIGSNRMALRMTPVLTGTSTLNSIRETALAELKSDDLDALLTGQAAEMDWKLDSRALKAYSPKNIKAA